MASKKQLFINIGFLIIVLWLTMWKLSKETDLREGLNQALDMNYFYLFIALSLIIIYVLMESVMIRLLLKKINKPYNFFDCAIYSFIGFLFSCITPSASGGQPAQMYYMKKRGIMVGESTPLLMIITIAYKGVLVIIGAVIMFFNISDIKDYLEGAGIYIYIGLVANVILLIFMILLLLKPKLLYTFCKKVYNGAIGKLLGKYRYSLRQKIVGYLDNYITTAIFYKGHYNNMALPILFLTFIQRIAYFAVTVAVYFAFNLRGVSILTIVILAASINVAVDMLPLPGGLGATELLFLSIFTVIFGQSKIVAALLVNRFLTFYILILLGVVAVIVANFRFKKSVRKKDDRIL